MFKMIKKPIKDWNLVDILIASTFGIGMIPVSLWIFDRSFIVIDKLENKFKKDKFKKNEVNETE